MEGTDGAGSAKLFLKRPIDSTADLLTAKKDTLGATGLTPDMKDVKLIEDELFDFDVPEEYLNISFNPDQEPSVNSMEEEAIHRSSSPAVVGTGYPSSTAHHASHMFDKEEGGEVDLITCMPWRVQSAYHTTEGCLMAFTPKPEEGQEDMRERGEGGKDLSIIESDSFGISRPTSACFEGKLRFEEEEGSVGGDVKVVGPTPTVTVLQRDVQLGAEPPDHQGVDSGTPHISRSNSMNATDHPSKLPTPKRQLKKCSTFDKSPVLCSELKQLREVRDRHDTSVSSFVATPSLPTAPRSCSGVPMVGVVRPAPRLDLDESWQSAISSCSTSSSVEPPPEPPSVGAMNAKAPGHPLKLKPHLVKSCLPRSVAPAMSGLPGKLQPPTSKAKLLPCKPVTKVVPLRSADPVDCATDAASRLTSVPLKLKPPTGFKSDPKLAKAGDENNQVPRPIKTLTKVLSSNLSKQELRSKLTTPPKQSRKAPTPRQQVRAPPTEGVANGTITSRPPKAGLPPPKENIPVAAADSSFSTSIMCVATPSAKQSTPAKSLPFVPSGELVTTPVKGVSPPLCLSSIDDQLPPTIDMERGGAEGHTPGSAHKRRSFIPTPGGRVHHHNTDPCSPVAERPPPPTGKVMPTKLQLNPKSRLGGLLKPRNGRMFGQQQTRQEGPMKAEHLDMDMDGGGIQSRTKVVHSPLNKENCPKTPHSQWSPIKRRPVVVQDECIRCTKRTVK